MAKRRAGSQIANLILNHKKSGIALISLYVGGVPHTIRKLSMSVTTLLQTSSQSKVCTQGYGSPKSQESQFWEFRESHFEVPKQNDI